MLIITVIQKIADRIMDRQRILFEFCQLLGILKQVPEMALLH